MATKPKLPKMAQDIVNLSQGSYYAQDWLVRAQQEYGPKQAAAEAATAGARSEAESGQVRSKYAGYRDALLQSSPEYKAAAEGFQARTGAANRIYGMLDQQAADELALGGALSGDEQREVSQASRGAWSDRGLATSGRAAIDEVLSRVSASNARKRERQAFAAQTAAQGSALATNNMSVAAAQFDPYQRLFGQGGSQVTGTLGTDQLFTPYANPAVDIYQTDKNYSAAMAQIASAEHMQKLGFKHDMKMTDINARYSMQIADRNAAAAKSAARTSLWGSGLGALGTLGAGAMIGLGI